MNRLLGRILLTGVVAALAVGGILALGHYLRDDLHSNERYQLTINEIECDPPPGQSRSEFIGEVHYYGRLPEKLNVLDADLPERLKTAFAKHPKVERVDKVTITPPKRVRVDLVLRK
jgi:hypothetical protein